MATVEKHINGIEWILVTRIMLIMHVFFFSIGAHVFHLVPIGLYKCQIEMEQALSVLIKFCHYTQCEDCYDSIIK